MLTRVDQVAPAATRVSLAGLWRNAVRISPALSIITAAMWAGAALSLVGIVSDSRMLLGVPIWLKPFKFFFSFALLFATVLAFLAQMREPGRLVRWINAVLIISATAEMVAIAGQAARGTMSHFNVSTSFDAAVFNMMGIMIANFQLALVGLAVVLLRTPIPNRPLAEGMRGGLIAMIAGTLVTGALMIASPTPAAHQATAAKYGVRTMGGGHAIGAPDDVPGIPIVGWSTQGGDLRAPHFLSLHALQILPLFGWILSRRHIAARRAVAVTRGAAIAYVGFILVLTFQALRGQSVIAPDTATMAMAGVALLAGVGYAVVAGRSAGAADSPAVIGQP